MRDLRGRADHHNLVLKKRAIGIIGMPEFRIEDLIERPRFKGVGRRKPNHMAAQIIGHIVSAADLGQRTGGKGFEDFLARVRRQPGELPICHAISHSPDFSIDRIGPKIHEPDTIILQLRWRNQRVVWRNGLRGVLHIEIGPEHYFVVITVQRGVKCRITIVGRVEHHVEDHKARSRGEQSIEQKRPHFA